LEKNKFHFRKIYIWNFPNIFVCPLYNTLKVSTVFLEINNGLDKYETIIFSEKKLTSCIKFYLDYQKRYETEKEAIEGHNKLIKDIKNKELHGVKIVGKKTRRYSWSFIWIVALNQIKPIGCERKTHT